jgi:hypothetical protein
MAANINAQEVYQRQHGGTPKLLTVGQNAIEAVWPHIKNAQRA